MIRMISWYLFQQKDKAFHANSTFPVVKHGGGSLMLDTKTIVADGAYLLLVLLLIVTLVTKAFLSLDIDFN